MTKSEIFKAAHEIARNTVEAVGNYMIAFSLALKEIYKSGGKMTKSAEQQLIDLGGKLWEKGNMRRVYLSLDVLNKITDKCENMNPYKHKFYYEDGEIIQKTGNKFYIICNFTESTITNA